MRLTAYTIMLFFVCLNVAFYMMNQTAVLGSMQRSPYSTPADITSMFISFNPNGTTLLISGVLISVGIIGWLAGGFVFGASTAILLGLLNLILVPVQWVVGGFPQFLGSIGVDPTIVTGITTLLAVVYFWFFLSFLSQRELPT
jgi:hypothetical protein